MHIISGVREVPSPSPTLAYVTATADVLAEHGVDKELRDIEAMGWRIVPVALEPAQRRPPAELEYASDCITLQAGARWLQAPKGFVAALRQGLAAARSGLMLLNDMRKLGLLQADAWCLPGLWLAAMRLAPRLRSQACTHVHAHGVHDPALIVMYAATQCAIPFTCMAFGPELSRWRQLLPDVAARSRGLMTASHYNKDWLEQRGVSGEQIAVVRSVPDLAPSPGNRSAATATATPASRRLRTGPYRIGMLGPLIERKGIDDALRALATLIHSGCAPVRLLIAGEGPERLRLQVLADQLGIHACVNFVGRVPPELIGTWLSTLDLYVAASKADRHGEMDGIPKALLEAMSVGLPVVATRLTGIPELVIDQQTGYLAEPDNPASLARQIDQAMGEPERARALGSAAKAHVRWEFGRERNIRRMVSCFQASAQSTSPAGQLEPAV